MACCLVCPEQYSYRVDNQQQGVKTTSLCFSCLRRRNELGRYQTSIDQFQDLIICVLDADLYLWREHSTQPQVNRVPRAADTEIPHAHKRTLVHPYRRNRNNS